MKQYLVLLALLCFLTGYVRANNDVSVSSKEAQEVAVNYYQKIRKDGKRDYTAGSPESFSLLGLANMWLVPVNDNWILVSTDKRAESVLARFLTTEKPDLKSYPPAAQYLISCYEHDIAYVRDSCPDCSIRDCWDKERPIKKRNDESLRYEPEEVDPLISANWDQYGNVNYPAYCDKTYNKFCPDITTTDPDLCGHAVAGCVAVAVGQIMHYWKWPYAADVPTVVGGSVREKKFYNWNLMPNYLSNSSSLEQVDMVAGFLRDCGYDMNMSYGESSGALDDSAKSTFKHFGYDESTIKLQAKWITPGWANIMHTEIAAGRPVYYSGRTAVVGGDGHAFILDGYDSQGLYHVNLGWGLYYNGYFYIDTIRPEVNGPQFSHWQAAIWGIQPDPSHCAPLTITDNITGPKFCIAQAGVVTLENVSLSNITDGRVYSETSIILNNGTYIANNCNVQFAIKPIPCELPIVPQANVSSNESTACDSNEVTVRYTPTHDLVELQTTGNVVRTIISSIDGKILMQKNNSMIHTDALPNGIYVVKVLFDDGHIYQSKVLLQR